MLAIFIGVAAALCGMTASVLLSSSGLMLSAWVAILFWTLVGAGIAVALINVDWACGVCALARRLHLNGLVERRCSRLG